MKVEYKVREVTRYIITRYVEEEHDNGVRTAGSEHKGEFDNLHTAQQVAYSLCRVEDMDSKDHPKRPKFKYPNVYPVETEADAG